MRWFATLVAGALGTLLLIGCGGGSNENLSRNPDFETDISSWNTWQGSLARIEGDSHSGNSSLSVKVEPGNEAYSAWQEIPLDEVRPRVGRTLLVTAWIKGTGASVDRAVHVILREEAGPELTRDGQGMYLITGDWQSVSTAREITTDEGAVTVVFVRPSDVTPEEAFLVDDVEVNVLE